MHVVVMTSETLFLEKIYNHSRLAKTSDFYKIDHFDQDTVQRWFEHEGVYEENMFNLVREYFGGAAIDLIRPINLLKSNRLQELKEHLNEQAKIYRGKISLFIADELDTEEEMEKCEEILRYVVNNGFIIRNSRDKVQGKILKKAIEKEFLFFDPADEKIIFNSQIVKKGAEMYLEKSGE